MLASSLQCTRCGAPVHGSAGLGLCAACAIKEALDLDASVGEIAAESPVIRRAGDYELLEEIARGGMGVVYRARQRSLGRIVALKVLLGGVFVGAEGKRRLHAEAAAAARLRHPNIVAVHEAGELDGQPFYSMDFIEGQTLADCVRLGPLAPARAARYVATIAEAVQYAHAQGVLHRDLKPSNVLIDGIDQPRVMDFGLAKQLANSKLETPDPKLTLSGQVLGSPAYMAPEQALGRHGQLSPACDVYSLGAILYELLTARPPFQGETPHATIDQVKSLDPIPPRRLNGSVPLDLETVCLKCLEKEPTRRYAAAKDLADELKRFLHHEPVHARPIGPAGKVWRTALRHPVVASLAVLSFGLLVTIAVIAAFSASRIRASRDDARARLAESLVTEARALRIAGQPGHRDASHQRLRDAQRLDTGGRLRLRLRQEAAASLAQLDLHRVTVTNLPPVPDHDPMLVCFDAAFERCAIWEGPHGVAIYQVNGGRRLKSLDLTGRTPDEICAFSRDGRFLAVRHGNVLSVWGVEEVRVVVSPERGEASDARAGAFSPDGRLFARGETGQRLAIYELPARSSAAATRPRDWPLPDARPLAALAWAPDTSALALASDEGKLAVCDGLTGQVRWQVDCKASLGSVAWSEANNLIAVRATPDRVVLFRAADGSEFRQINTPTDRTSSVAFSPDGAWLVSAAEHFGVRFHDSFTGEGLLADSGRSWHLHFDTAGRRLGSMLDHDRPAWVELKKSPIMHVMRAGASRGENQALCFSADGLWLSSLSYDGPMIWEVARRRHAATVGLSRAVFAIFDSGAGRLIASQDDGVWEVELGSALKTDSALIPVKIAAGKRFWGLAASRERGWIAAADHVGGWVHWLGRDRKLLRRFGPIHFPAYVQFSPDARWLAVANGQTDFIFDLNNPDTAPRELPGGEPTPKFSADGRWLVTLGQGARLWRVGTWQPEPVLPLETSPGGDLVAAFSPDSRWLAVTQRLQEIHLIDLAARQTLTILEGPGEGRVLDIAFSPDGHLLAAARDRGEVQLWDLPALRRELAALNLNW